ncbi:MAG: Mrp/NBP35 family ATP-binding protein, partial [Thermodesulfobacteriota bacterium]|nr:Mrp/NBP35 family ATP-binding protein [Thermodesulfobacteriota bacterium]
EKQEKAQEQQEQLKKRLSRIKNIIMVMSGKGGVGKSTVSANLSLGLAKEGYKVGVLDADIHGPNMPKILGSEANKLQADADGNIVPIEAHSNLSLVSVGYLLDSRDTPVIWRGPMKHTAISQFIKDVNWGDLDFLVVDLPPGTGDEPLSIAQLIKGVEGIDAPYAVVVTTPQDVALLDSRKSVEFARALELRFLGVIENMSGFVCPHCGERIDLFKVGGGKKAAEEMKVPFLGVIPIDTGIVKDTDDGVPFMSRNDNSAANTAFSGIIKNILDTI